MGGDQLLEQVIRGVAADADLPENAAEDVDEERVRDGAVLQSGRRTAGKRDAELEFGRGHEGRFYSERRPKSTRARVQSAAI